uniref:Uncharacterized protein n=1 Tax=Lepeophtheirus salmonis TaxID=72036 RepID=A0A0K2TEJ2_LEPSM
MREETVVVSKGTL